MLLILNWFFTYSLDSRTKQEPWIFKIFFKTPSISAIQNAYGKATISINSISTVKKNLIYIFWPEKKFENYSNTK